MGGMEELNLKLGRKTEEGSLDAVPRQLSREKMDPLAPFFGYDLWNAYEVSFMTPTGKPAVYHMQAFYAASTPNIVESKSFKLFLNSTNMRVFANLAAFASEVKEALTACVGGPVQLTFYEPEQSPAVEIIEADLLDQLEPRNLSDIYDPTLLRYVRWPYPYSYKSHLLRSNCPVTNQPDWGTVWIRGEGPLQPDPLMLLDYIISFRNHQDFHEACCETIFNDLFQLLSPDKLEVSCFYTRRGGLDINPYRSTHNDFPITRASFWRQ